jgi:YVTN family beta-propeller protein
LSSIVLQGSANAGSPLKVIANIDLAGDPYGLACTPDSSTVYIALLDANAVAVVDTATNTVTSTIPLSTTSYGDPAFVAITPDGSTVFVDEQGGDGIAVISTASNSVVGYYPAATEPGNIPAGVAVTPDGTQLYVANEGTGNNDGSISIVDTSKFAIVNTIQTRGSCNEVVFSPDGTTAYALNSGNFISVIDTASQTITKTITNKKLSVAFYQGMALAGENLYISISSGKVLPISTLTYKARELIKFDGSTGAIVPAPSGDFVYVSVGGEFVQTVDVSTNKKFEKPVKPYSTYLAITPDGKYIYSTGGTPKGATVSVIRITN